MAEEKKGTNWLLTCGIGCGVLVVIGVIAMVVMGYLAKSAMDEGLGVLRDEAATQAQAVYAELQASEKIPADDAALYQTAYDITQNTDASFWAVGLASGTFAHLDDGVVSEEERNIAVTITDYLSDNPDVGIIGLSQFVGQNPEVQSAFDELQQSAGSYQ